MRYLSPYLLAILISSLLQISQAQRNFKTQILHPKPERLCQLPNGDEGICVYGYLCRDGKINVYGEGIIDIRTGDICEDYMLKCCSKEISCQNGKGKCVTEDNCGIDLPAQSNGTDCLLPTHCCPTEFVGKSKPKTIDPEIKKCSRNTGICVPPNQCSSNPDGINILQPRISECSEGSICCPNQHLLNQEMCLQSSGVWVPTAQCRIRVDAIGALQQTFGHICCPQEEYIPEDVTTVRTTKKCQHGLGTCVEKDCCGKQRYMDRRNECNGLTCCASVIPCTSTGPSTREPVTSEEAETIVPEITTPTVHQQSCKNLGGTCQISDNCNERVLSTECENEGKVCCTKIATPETPETPETEEREWRGCGYRNIDGVLFKAVNTIEGESQYGEYPWMVAIMEEEHGNKKYICGGSLIDSEVILTTAQCVRPYKSNIGKLIVRAGEWDMNSTSEPFAFSEIRVKSIDIHPKFKSSSLINNVALLFLEESFKFSKTIDTICLPPQDFDIHNGYVVASGWGTTPKDRLKKLQILKSIELPFYSRYQCEDILRANVRNKKFRLDESFMCAGGADEVDMCTGDAGSPLIFEVPDDNDGRYFVVGMVAWGIGCGRSGIPAAYTDVSRFREWIDEQFDKAGIPTTHYTYLKDDSAVENVY